MIRLYDFDEVRPEEILNRDIRAEADVEATVDAIIADVRARGDAALIEYAAKFDHAELTDVRVSQAEIEEAFAELEKTDPEFITTLKMAAENIRHFHEQQLHKNFVVNDKPGIVLGQKYTPIQRAGVYVPGGTAAYPSTVLMDVIPAKVAGVGQIVMTTPAGRDGKVNPAILAAAVIAGIDLIFKTGGAQAVAALAYGTESVPAVDKIVGPGNIYVATAKRKVFGKVGIDMIAGPSEILVLARDLHLQFRLHLQPRVGRRRPAQPGRARQAGQPGARHRQLGVSQGRAGGTGGADPAAAPRRHRPRQRGHKRQNYCHRRHEQGH